MGEESLTQVISRLSPEQQVVVRRFIEFIERKGKVSAETPFLNAVEEFMAEHRELLHLLAQ